MRDLFSGIYPGRRVLVTGHTGFKGSWLALWLSALGAKVCGYALDPPTDPSLFERLRLEDSLDHRIADVRDPDSVRRAMAEFEPEIVFHLAAQSLVRAGYRAPRETYETNLMGTVNVLEAVRHTPSVRVCLCVSSDKCYENREWEFAYRENDPLGGYDPYSSSKACAEIATAAYGRSYFNPLAHERHGVSLASLRAGNVIGGGDWADDRLIPDCVRALAARVPIAVRNPQAIRPWQHVLDPLSGYLWMGTLLWQHPARFTGGWNIGPTAFAGLKVAQVVDLAVQTWGEGSWEEQHDPHAVHEARTLRLDCSKAANELGWLPAWDAREAVIATVKWYREFYSHSTFNVRDLSLAQIEDFVASARKKEIAWAAKQP
ncbi:CDP-glucose 4,6-dehydratase [bacterium]|nr:CDP-glucose 4,6-dehydratase [bacterium]